MSIFGCRLGQFGGLKSKRAEKVAAFAYMDADGFLSSRMKHYEGLALKQAFG